MPRPGGGGNSGGFGGGRGSGGGSRGGFGGGGYGGGPYHHGPGHYGPHFHRHRYFGFGPMWYRPYYGGYYGGGGCLGGLVGMLLLPIIMILFAVIILVSSLGSALTNVASGGSVIYNESTFQSYARDQYSAEFGENVRSYEDNILIVFTTNETYDSYYAIAMVGNNIDYDIYDLFGNEYTTFGIVTKNSIPDYYENTLYDDLARIANKMASSVEALGLESPFIDETVGAKTESHLTNKSGLSMDTAHTDKALRQFTEKTGIPLVIVVDEAEDVFGKTIPTSDWITALIAIGIIALAIWFIVRAVKARKQSQNQNDYTNGRNDNNSGNGGYNNNGYGNGNWYNNGF